jgi:hypothetical protein
MRRGFGARARVIGGYELAGVRRYVFVWGLPRGVRLTVAGGGDGVIGGTWVGAGGRSYLGGHDLMQVQLCLGTAARASRCALCVSP